MAGMLDSVKEAVHRAIKSVGGAHGLAKACGVSYQAVYKWRMTGVSAERAIQIEEVTQGGVTRHELRPDLFPCAPPVGQNRRAGEGQPGQGDLARRSAE